MNTLVLAENIMIKDWATMSANTVEALKIMCMGILAIFIVISIIMVAVYILNAIDKKLAEKNAPKEPAVAAANNGVESKSATAIPVAPAVGAETAPVEDREVSLEELREPKYRKTGDPYPDSKYRKTDED